MKASDETIHQQLAHICNAGRKAIGSEVMVVITSFHDEEKDANAVLLLYGCSDELVESGQEAMTVEVMETMFRGVNNILKAHTKLELILRDKESGQEFRPGDNTFGHYSVEVEQ